MFHTSALHGRISIRLVVDGRTLNISPYNRDYERNVYALEPQPRAVANAVVGY